MRKRQPKRLTIPSEWYRLLPAQPLAFWVRLEKVRRTTTIRKTDMIAIRRLAKELLQQKRRLK